MEEESKAFTSGTDRARMRTGRCVLALSHRPFISSRRRLSYAPPPLLLLRAVFLAWCCCGGHWLRPVGALVSYCRAPTPHSYSHAQAETICEIEGEYNYKTIVDQGNAQNVLYGDLGSENLRKRYTAMTLEDRIVAKYANLSEFILHVQVLSVNETYAAHHCCQVCYLDCEQFRYSCPVTGVDADNNCTTDSSQVTRCRFTESILRVKARIVCAVKWTASGALNTSWFTDHFFLRSSARFGCPYRKLESGAYYLLAATLSTRSSCTDDTLVGADVVIALPKKSKTLPVSLLRGVALPLRSPSDNRTLVHVAGGRNQSYCPSASSLRLSRSGAVPGAGRSSALITALAVVAASLAVAPTAALAP